MQIHYEKDSAETSGTLAANFGFTSSAIEASLIFSGITNKLSFSQVITGTKASPKTIEVQNDGFKEGVIKSFDFYDKSNRVLAKCSSIDPITKEIECKKISGAKADLSEIFFKIYDLNNTPCLGRNISPKGLGVAGEKCFFNLVYWPSTKFEDLDNDFINQISLFVEYDTRLQGKENLKNSFISSISYQFKKPALLKIVSFESEGEKILFDEN